jgi:hypothetical protein
LSNKKREGEAGHTLAGPTLTMGFERQNNSSTKWIDGPRTVTFHAGKPSAGYSNKP